MFLHNRSDQHLLIQPDVDDNNHGNDYESPKKTNLELHKSKTIIQMYQDIEVHTLDLQTQWTREQLLAKEPVDKQPGKTDMKSVSIQRCFHCPPVK